MQVRKDDEARHIRELRCEELTNKLRLIKIAILDNGIVAVPLRHGNKTLLQAIDEVLIEFGAHGEQIMRDYQ